MTTKVKIVGFKVEFCPRISIGEFFQRLESAENEQSILGDRDVKLYVDDVDGYIVGLLLSFKRDRKSVITEEKDGEKKLIIEKQELKKGQHNSEANIFVINPSTLDGAYYSYFGALTHTRFERFLAKIHDKIRKEKIREKKKEYEKHDGSGMNSKKAYEKAKEFYAGDFKFTLKISEKDIDSVLDVYEKISSLELSVTGAIPDANIFTPASNFITTTNTRVGFKAPKNGVSALKAHVKSLMMTVVGSNKSKMLKVIGRTLSGEEKHLYLGDNMDFFGEMDYDRYVDLLPNKYWDDYTNSGALSAMLKIIQSKPHIFGDKPKKGWKLISRKGK